MAKLFNARAGNPLFVLLTIFALTGCSKGDSSGGGSGPVLPPNPTAPTLTINPGTAINTVWKNPAQFTITTNGTYKTVNGIIFSGTVYTTDSLEISKDYTIVSFSSNLPSALSTTVIVRVSVGQNPAVTTIINGPWRIFKKQGRTTGPWFDYTIPTCELDDTHQFNADSTVTNKDNAIQCIAIPYPPGTYAFSQWNTKLTWKSSTTPWDVLKLSNDTLRIYGVVPCSGPGCPPSGTAEIMETYIH